MLGQLAEAEPWNVGEKPRFFLLAGLAVFVAAAGGYAVGLLTAPASPSGAGEATERSAASATAKEAPRALDPEQVEAETSAAFAAMKERRFEDARTRFRALAAQGPRLHPVGLEVARCFLYEGNCLEAQRTLEPYLTDERTAAEAHFLFGLVKLTERDFELAANYFRRAAAAAPTRADAHYMLAEALRRAGKNSGASPHYRAALARNQVETNELTYRLKLWISEVQDGTLSESRRAELAAALQKPDVGSEPLIVEAAVRLKAGDFAGAAQRLGEASKLMEPLLFKVMLFDPLFSQEAWRPELAPFYKR